LECGSSAAALQGAFGTCIFKAARNLTLISREVLNSLTFDSRLFDFPERDSSLRSE